MEDDEDEKPIVIPEINENEAVDCDERAIIQTPPWDTLTNAKIALHNGDELAIGRVARRSLGPDGTVAGRHDENPILNSIVCEVEFRDGQIKECAANVLAENLPSQIDSEGFSAALFDGILDWCKDSNAVEMKDRFLVTKRGQRRH